MDNNHFDNNHFDNNYFHAMYRGSDDPWGFTTRWYEERKYHLTLAALPKRRYRNAFEAGCSIGVFTELLAHRCDKLLTVDLSARATSIAAERLEPFADRVEVQTRDFVADWPTGTFDLIVLSEVLYYLDPAQFDAVVEQSRQSLAEDGHLVAVHWRRKVEEYPTSGDRVHELLSQADLPHVAGYRDGDFLLDIYSSTAGQTAAELEGLV
ncbi:SAM-dependent methyltransferase [Williamsia sp.]|uniref:SAM-dependent methyltransferase n=1 Tax=Williamsia sp. TaxID=1872085 RepID=UPI002F93BA20